jgi:hypothetical protein
VDAGGLGALTRKQLAHVCILSKTRKKKKEGGGGGKDGKGRRKKKKEGKRKALCKVSKFRGGRRPPEASPPQAPFWKYILIKIGPGMRFWSPIPPLAVIFSVREE